MVGSGIVEGQLDFIGVPGWRGVAHPLKASALTSNIKFHEFMG
jgi:hypothetical protein